MGEWILGVGYLASSLWRGVDGRPQSSYLIENIALERYVIFFLHQLRQIPLERLFPIFRK